MCAVGDTAALVRLVAASTLVGLAAFCIAHVVQVWRKRNARPGRGAPPGRRLAWACLLAGATLLPASAVHRELTRDKGVLTGEGLFTVRAGEDQEVEWLTDVGAVVAGDPVARFGSVTRSARAEEMQARLARVEAERDILALLPLTSDPELTRLQQAVSQERTQAQQELGQAVIAAAAADRDLTAQIFAKKEALARLELTLTERRKELDRAALRSEHCRLQLTTLGKLTGGSVSLTEYQNQLKASRDADIELASLTQEVKDLAGQKVEFRSQLDTLEATRSEPAAPLRKQIAATTQRITRLTAEEADLKAKIEKDHARAAKLREAENSQAAAKVREQQAGVRGAVRERQVPAPFPGTIAFRADSPNAVRAPGTLAVLAPEGGFRLTARMTQSDAGALRNGAEVTIDLGEEAAERWIPARFCEATPLAHEPGYSTVQLACLPSADTVRRLAEGERLTVTFAWHPPLTAMWPFRTGLLLFAAGLLGLFLTGLRRAGGRVGPAVVPDITSGRLLEVRTVGGPGDPGEGSERVEGRPVTALAVPNKGPVPRSVPKLLALLRRLWPSRKTASGSDRFDCLRQVLVPKGAPAAPATDVSLSAEGSHP
jgi:hypothetical protein